MCGYGALRAPPRNLRSVMPHAMGWLSGYRRSGIVPLMASGGSFHHRMGHAGPQVHTCRPLGELTFTRF